MRQDGWRRTSRRRFIALGAAAGALVAAMRSWRVPAAQHEHAEPARAVATESHVLDATQWALVEAMTARIIPSENGLGAREANVVRFIDRALAGPDRALIVKYTTGLAGLDAVARAMFGLGFLEIDAERQDRVLEALEGDDAPGWPPDLMRSSEFFAMGQLHAVQGFLSDPVHGGNQDQVGWRLIGYPGPRHRSGGVSERQLLGLEKLVPSWQGGS